MGCILLLPNGWSNCQSLTHGWHSGLYEINHMQSFWLWTHLWWCFYEVLTSPDEQHLTGFFFFFTFLYGYFILVQIINLSSLASLLQMPVIGNHFLVTLLSDICSGSLLTSSRWTWKHSPSYPCVIWYTTQSYLYMHLFNRASLYYVIKQLWN